MLKFQVFFSTTQSCKRLKIKMNTQNYSKTSINEHIHYNVSHCCLLCSTDFKDWRWTEFVVDSLCLLAVLSLLTIITRELAYFMKKQTMGPQKYFFRGTPEKLGADYLKHCTVSSIQSTKCTKSYYYILFQHTVASQSHFQGGFHNINSLRCYTKYLAVRHNQ